MKHLFDENRVVYQQTAGEKAIDAAAEYAKEKVLGPDKPEDPNKPETSLWFDFKQILKDIGAWFDRKFSSLGFAIDEKYNDAFGPDRPVPLTPRNNFPSEWDYLDYHERKYNELYTEKMSEIEPFSSKVKEYKLIKEQNDRQITEINQEILKLSDNFELPKKIQSRFYKRTTMYKLQGEKIDNLLSEKDRLSKERANLQEYKVDMSWFFEPDPSKRKKNPVSLDKAINLLELEIAPLQEEADYFKENEDSARYWREEVEEVEDRNKDNGGGKDVDDSGRVTMHTSDTPAAEAQPKIETKVEPKVEPQAKSEKKGFNVNVNWS